MDDRRTKKTEGGYFINENKLRRINRQGISKYLG